MKTKTNSTRKQNTTTAAPKGKSAKANRTAKAKTAKTAKKAKKDKPTGPVDRLPSTIAELKATKGGLVCYLFFSGKAKD